MGLGMRLGRVRHRRADWRGAWRERQHSRYGPTRRDKLMQPKRILELVSFTLGRYLNTITRIVTATTPSRPSGPHD
jgi:hypothetical protein